MATIIAPSKPHGGLRARALRLQWRLSRVWHNYPRESVGALLIALIAATAMATTQLSPSRPPAHLAASPPSPPPMTVRPIAPDQAVRVNSEIPVAGGPNPAAASFIFKGSAATRAQAMNCLASAVYYEAGNQDVDGERAVAQVVLNRVRHPAFPSSICGVVYQGSTKPTGCQFTFTCDGSLNHEPDSEGWKRALEVAAAALKGYVYAPVGWATHYHANYVVPDWASTMAKNAVIGAHLFYRWAGAWGEPAVFTKTYASREPNAAALRLAALSAPHIAPIYDQKELAQAIKNIPGAEPLKLSPSLRGDKRVAVRFNLVARKASDQVKSEDYTKQFAVSDNLKWSLSSEAVAQNQQPLGRSAASPAPLGATGQH